MSNKLYDILKWIAIIVLPAIATAYGVIAKIWNLPYLTEIPATITAAATLLGAILGVSTISYNKENDEEAEEA